MRFVFSILLVFSLFATNQTVAQSTEGKDFWVAFPDGDLYCRPRTDDSMMGIWWDDTLEVFVTSKYKTKVSVTTNPDFDPAYSKTVDIMPNVPYRFQLPSEMACRSLMSEFKLRYGVHIVSDSLVSVQAVHRYWTSKGSTTVMPTESIPENPEYFVTTNQNNAIWVCFTEFTNKISKSSEFVVVAITDSCEVEVIPMARSATENEVINRPINVRLNKGQVFPYVSSDFDLTGTTIRSRTPGAKFAVFAGNRLTYSEQEDSNGTICRVSNPIVIKYHNNLTNLEYMDHTFEQMIPTVSMGNSYTAIPFKNSLGGYYLKIVGIEDYTKVYIDGVYYTTLNQSDYFTWNSGTSVPIRITADKRISVTQFSKSVLCNQHTMPKKYLGDISQVQLTPDELYTGNVRINNVTDGKITVIDTMKKAENYFNVLVKETDTAVFTINGNKVAPKLWKPISGGMAYTQFKMKDSLYTLNSPKGFQANYYGYAQHEGNVYNATTSFKKLRPDFYSNTQCYNDTSKFKVAKSDSFTNFKWSYNNKYRQFTGDSFRYKVPDTGFISVTMYYNHVRTNALDSVRKKLYFGVGSKMPILINDTLICGYLDLELFCNNFNRHNYYTWENGSGVYYRTIRYPGQYWVSVTGRNGCTTRDTLNLKNFPFPVARFTLTDTHFCLNKNRPIIFTNTSHSIDSIVTNQWDFGDQNIINNDTVIPHVYTKANTYLIHLRVTTVNDCVHDTFKVIDILPSPDPQFDIVKIDSCFNTNYIVYKNNTVIDSAYHKRFKWYFSEGFVISNGNPTTPRKYTQPGTYTTHLIYEYNNGCLDSFRRKIVIYKNPEANFTLKNPLFCIKDTVHFVNTSTSVHQPLKYQWQFGDSTFDTIIHAVHQFKKAGNYSTTLIAISPQSCKDTIQQSIKMFGAPKAQFVINDSQQCFTGNNFTMMNTSVADTGILKPVLWQFSNGASILNKDTITKIYTTSGTQWARLTVANIFGCTDSITKTVILDKDPVVVFRINDWSQCFKQQQFNLNYIRQSANDSIQQIKWLIGNDSMLNVASVNNYKFNSIGQFPVRLILTSTKGCKGQAVNYVYVNASPLAKISTPFPSQCFSLHSFTYTDSSQIAQGKLVSSKWNFGDTTSSILKLPPAKKYKYPGTYTVQLISVSDSGCSDTGQLNIALHPGAGLKIQPIAPVCLGDSSLFVAKVTNGNILQSRWYFGDNTFAFSDSVKHRYDKAGVYNVSLKVVTNQNCADSVYLPGAAIVYSLPIPRFKYDIMALEGQTDMRFEDITQPTPTSLLWNFGPYGSSVQSDTTISLVDSATVYARLTVTDHRGCKNTLQQNVFASVRTNLFFPTAFSPNGDGINEGFGPQGMLVARQYSFKIYNRWGEKVFDSETPGETWDGTYMGKLCPVGTFVYILTLTDYRNQDKKIRGTVTLLW
ncbi:MAG: PKD domain-containing protein [Bacteroidota bacterium]